MMFITLTNKSPVSETPYLKSLKDHAKNTPAEEQNKKERRMSLKRLTLVFLRQRERLRYRETLKSLNAFRSSPKPSLGNFLRAYWYLWAASFIFPFWRTHGGQTCGEEPERETWGGGPKYSPDSPAIAALWLEPSLLINHTYKTHRHAQIRHTHTQHLICPFCQKTQSIKCQASIMASLVSGAEKLS